MLIYWASSSVGFVLAAIEANISPIWPPSGFAAAAIFLGGYRLLPGILAGALAANACNDLTLISAFAIAIGSCGEAALAGWLLNRIRPLGAQLGKYTIPIWILGTSLFAPMIAATIGSLSVIHLNTREAPLDFWELALTWLAGDSIGILIIVPVLLSLSRPKLSIEWFTKLICISTLSLMVYAFFIWAQPSSAYYFLAFALLIPACRFFGEAGCALSTLSFVVFTIVTILTTPDSNPFASSNNELLSLVAFLIALSITSLTIASLYEKNRFLVPSILFIVGWTTSGLIYFILQNAAAQIDEENFTELIHDIESAVTDRLDTYLNTLIAGAGHYINSEELKTEEWRSFVQHLKIVERYPGINGIGFIQPFHDTEIPSFVAKKRASGLPDFKIKEVPNVERPATDVMGYEHFIITYIEPLSTNHQALGLDVASEINRQTAGQRARDSGKPAMTGRIILVQDGMSRPGFLVFHPMYQAGAPTETVEQRRQAFIGWSYAPFITEVFLNGVLGNREDQIQFHIYDSPKITPSNFVYSTTGSRPETETAKYAHKSSLKLADQTFSFGWNRGQNFPTQETASATIAAASLALGSCLLVVIVVNLQSTNRRAQHIVAERTLELHAANEKLQKEVSERQKAESDAKEAHQIADTANKAKSEFLATMSHEIRTPMNSVIGFAELLCGSELNADQRLWATYIQSSGNSLLALINDILDFSKIEAGKFELEAIPFSIHKTLDQVVTGFEPIAAQKGLLINLETSEDLPAKVVGDPTRLKQVITNLIGNSLKFTKTGTISVTADWQGDQANGVAEISVTDSGIGIPKSKIKNLFQRFSQVDSSTTRQYGGSGLGLAICKRIINLMDGEIKVESTEGKGTTMNCSIPFTCSDQAKNAATKPPFIANLSNEANENKRRVLVVDDNAVNRRLAQTVLRRLGNEVDTANNGVEAIEQVSQHFYDIVFLDCQMPVMDGYVAAERIRELEADGKIPGSQPGMPLPIVALTANASEKDRHACLSCGMDDYISKPAKIDDYRTIFKQLDENERGQRYRA
ncbi:CHASE domain-containing protein [Coraliomargarita algicola]